jgi:hypothetical protein
MTSYEKARRKTRAQSGFTHEPGHGPGSANRTSLGRRLELDLSATLMPSIAEDVATIRFIALRRLAKVEMCLLETARVGMV